MHISLNNEWILIIQTPLFSGKIEFLSDVKIFEKSLDFKNGLLYLAEVHDSVFIAMPYHIWSAKYGIKMKFFRQSIAYSIRFPDIIYSNVRNA